jgi:hypothetical protein
VLLLLLLLLLWLFLHSVTCEAALNVLHCFHGDAAAAAAAAAHCSIDGQSNPGTLLSLSLSLSVTFK